MSSKRLHYSDEKWLDLISECRSSGLSDKDWCMEHQIGISTFYYHVKRLRNKACSIPPAAVGAVIPCQKQEVVELNFNTVSELPMNCSSEEITATAEVRETFKISKVGTIAGCMVKEGKLTRSAKIRVIRDGIVIYTGTLGSLKRFKDDVKEVASGYDCGLNVDNFNDIKVGDIIESYTIVEIKRKL